MNNYELEIPAEAPDEYGVRPEETILLAGASERKTL